MTLALAYIFGYVISIVKIMNNPIKTGNIVKVCFLIRLIVIAIMEAIVVFLMNSFGRNEPNLNYTRTANKYRFCFALF